MEALSSIKENQDRTARPAYVRSRFFLIQEIPLGQLKDGEAEHRAGMSRSTGIVEGRKCLE
jgi:hypothetical protein